LPFKGVKIRQLPDDDVRTETMATARAKTGRSSRRCHATPARLRPHCYAIRKDLDPGLYATDKELDTALATGTYKVGCGCRTAAEVHAMLEDCLI